MYRRTGVADLSRWGIGAGSFRAVCGSDVEILEIGLFLLPLMII